MRAKVTTSSYDLSGTLGKIIFHITTDTDFVPENKERFILHLEKVLSHEIEVYEENKKSTT